MTYSTPLEEYFTTVYPSKCLPYSPKWLSTKEGLVFSSRLITLFSLPIQFLTVYCILKKTPESMNFVKKSLLNLNFWCILSGGLLSFFLTPFSFFPYFAGFSIGFATNLRIPIELQLYISFVLTFAILISITILFENRSSLIHSNIFGIKKPIIRKIWIFLNFFGSFTILAPVFLNPPEQNSAKMEILKILPCPAKEFFTDPFIVMASSPFWKSYFTISILLIYTFLLLQILFFSLLCMYYLYIFKSSQMSLATRKLQIRSFFGILGQTLIPILFASCPMIVFLNRQTNGDYDQFNNNLMGLSIIIHGGATSLSILLVQHPYRSFLKSAVFGRWLKKVEVNISRNLSTKI